jgi:hypothetical protein
MELMDIFKQINVYTANIAKTYLDTMGKGFLSAIK